MLEPTFYAAISFFIFVAFLKYKKCFGASELLNASISKIDDEIKQAAYKRKKAKQRLSESQAYMHVVESKIAELREVGNNSIEQLKNRKRQEIAKAHDELERRFSAQIMFLERQYARTYKDQFVDQVMLRVKAHLQKNMSSETLAAHLKEALAEVDPTMLGNHVYHATSLAS